MSKFKSTHTFEKRKSESDRINLKYSDKIPVIAEIHENSINELNLDKIKYLVPHDLTVGQFIYIIRKRTKFDSEKALFVFFNNTLAPISELMGNLYQKSKDNDGFLYATISLESTFGYSFVAIEI